MIPLRDSQPSHSTPYVTAVIIAANVLIFLFELMLDQRVEYRFMMTYAIIPARLELTDFATSMFLHGGWMHLIGNMWFLWIYGDNVEDILGPLRYILFYVLCGAAAGLLQVLFHSSSQIPLLGASGAIAGVMGAYLRKFPGSRITTLVTLGFIFFRWDIPAPIILLYWFAIQFFSGVGDIASAESATRGGTAWFAHIGGFVAGFLLIGMMRLRQRRTQFHDYA